ncbi:MAG: DnaJ domain-containing protein [Gammaproteobacteria bacterium]|nr:DnaJ domain-containing protein [Gammaproteobacteria bacterium]
MEIPFNLNIIFGFVLFFAVAYFFAWLLVVKFWLVKIFAVIGGLKLLEIALVTGSNAILASVILAYIVFFRESILRLFQGFLEWFYIIKDHLEALIRILLYPFLYAYKYVVLNKESVDNFQQEQQNQKEEEYQKAWDDVNQEKDKAHQSQKSSEEARRKAEQEKEYYKEQARKAREEANKNQEQDNSSESNFASNRETKVETRTPEQILGLNPGFTKAELKKSYRFSAGRYHPDKYAHMSTELQEEMAEEFKKVQGAYKALRSRVV